MTADLQQKRMKKSNKLASLCEPVVGSSGDGDQFEPRNWFTAVQQQ